VIRSRRNTVHYLGLGSYQGKHAKAVERGPSGDLDRIERAPDGSFEVRLSCTERLGKWLRFEPRSDRLIVRQSFQDRRVRHSSVELPRGVVPSRVLGSRSPLL